MSSSTLKVMTHTHSVSCNVASTDFGQPKSLVRVAPLYPPKWKDDVMKENRTRPHRVVIHLNSDELTSLNQKVKQTSYNRESYIRCLILGKTPSPKPSEDFQEVIKQLRMIGNNLNQITVVAHKTGSIDILKFKQAMTSLNEAIIEIRKQVYLPKESS